MRTPTIAALVAATCIAAPAPPAGAFRGLLPYVGTIDSVDVAGRSLVLTGPDGAKRTFALPEGAVILSEAKGAPPTLEQLAEAKGKPVGVFLKTVKEAQWVSLVEPDEAETEVWLRAVLADEKGLRFENLDGGMLSLKPAVNLGASSKPDEKPQSADWAWFEKRLGQPFKVRTVRVMGMTFLWSVSSWTPKPEEKPAGQRQGGR